MLYLHGLGILIQTVERIVAKEAMQDRPNIHMQRIFATDLLLVNNYHLILPTHFFVQLLPFGRELHEHKDYIHHETLNVKSQKLVVVAPKEYYLHQEPPAQVVVKKILHTGDTESLDRCG